MCAHAGNTQMRLHAGDDANCSPIFKTTHAMNHIERIELENHQMYTQLSAATKRIAELEVQNKSITERLISATKEIDRLRIEADKNYKGYKFKP